MSYPKSEARQSFPARASSFLYLLSAGLALALCAAPALCYGATPRAFTLVLHIAAAVVLLLILLRKYIDGGWVGIAGSGTGIPLTLFLAAILFSSIRSIYLFNTRMELFRLATYFIVFISAAAIFRTEARLKLLSYSVIVSAVIISLIGMAKAAFGPILAGFWPRAEFSTFLSQDAFQVCVSMGLAMALAFLFCKRGRLVKALSGAASFILLGSLAMTSDKGGWAGLAAMAVFILVIMGREGLLKRKFWFVVLFVTLFLWTAAVFGGLDKITEKFIAIFIVNPKNAFIIDYDTTLWERASIWRSSLEAVLRHPFLGVGLGNFRLAYPLFRDASIGNLVEHAHQDYLEFAAETGLVGLFSFLWLGIIFFRKMFYGIQGSTGLLALKVGAFSACFVMAWHGLYEFSFHVPSNTVLFMFSCGILFALYLMRRRGNDGPRARRVNIPRPAWLTAILITAVYISYLGKLLIADAYYENGVSAMNDFLFTGAESSFKKAVSFVPYNAEYAARLGELYVHRARFKNGRELYLRRALSLYERAASLSPYDGGLRVESGIAYERFGKTKEAEEAFNRALSLDPNNFFYRAMLENHRAGRKDNFRPI